MADSREQGREKFFLTALLVAILMFRSWSLVQSLDSPFARPIPGTAFFRTLAGTGDFSAGTLDRVKTDEREGLVLDPTGGLHAGTGAIGGYTGPYLYGTYLSPVWSTVGGVDSIATSWSADTPAGTWLKIEARALQGDTWTKYYTMAVWASGTSVVRRQNAGAQEDAAGLVDTDDLMLKRPALAVQLRATLFTTSEDRTPRLRRLSVVATGPGFGGGEAAAGTDIVQPHRRAWGIDLPVPERRQNDFPEGAYWCSPASVSMMMAYWAERTGTGEWDRSVPETAAGVRDFQYGGTGNWVFNTAYAASLGLDTYVTRYDSLAGVERWIAAGVPVAINIEFGRGELAGAPMPRSDGHIIVIRGFDRRGNPIVNDPASRADQGEDVRIVFDREELEKAWQGRPKGTVYIIYPPGHRGP